MSNSGTTHAGAGGAGKANFQDISVTKFIDKASPDLMQHTANGKIYPKPELLAHKPCVECKADEPYYTLRIENILVSSVSTGGSGGEDRLTENVSLNFSKVQWCYSEQNPDGSFESPICGDWDIELNDRL